MVIECTWHHERFLVELQQAMHARMSAAGFKNRISGSSALLMLLIAFI